MARYDYGLRGYGQTSRPMMRGRMRLPDYDLAYDLTYPAPRDPRALPNRVTSRYNRDYTMPRGRDAYDRNFSMFTGDRMDRMGDERYYRRPYITNGGTWTMRGSSFPTGYDYPVYGPNYGGRYPDEL